MTDVLTYDNLRDDAAERALVGSMFVWHERWADVAILADGSDFWNVDLGKAFDAIVTLAQSGASIGDTPFLIGELRKVGVSLTKTEIMRLVEESGSGGVGPYYADRVRNMANLRRIRHAALGLLERCEDREAVPVECIGWMKAKLDALVASSRWMPEKFVDVAERIVADLRSSAESSGPGVLTGIWKLDDHIGRIHAGNLLVIAARPGVGKTSLGMQIAAHNSARGRAVLFVSLEMTADELVGRLLASKAEVSASVLRRGTITTEQVNSIASAAVDMAAMPLVIHAPAMAKMMQIEATAKIIEASVGLSLIVVDYIGLVSPDDRNVPRHEQVSEVSRSLKRVAKEMRIPVIALCQLNREAEKEVPLLSHLRESGAIEQDADMVWFIHFPDGRHKTDTDGNIPAEVIVAKNRHGATGKIDLTFKPQLTKFSERNYEWNPNGRDPN